MQEVADHVGVHRTIAYRLLATLAEFRLVAKGEDGRYRPAAGLATLGASFDHNVRQLCLPTLRTLADELGTTVSLLVAEGDEQVAIAVIVPTQVAYQLANDYRKVAAWKDSEFYGRLAETAGDTSVKITEDLYRKGSFNVFGWVRNAFNQDYFELLSTQSGSTGLIVGQPGDPRTFGGTISKSF